MNGIKRDLFPIVEEKPYFNTCSIGPLSIPVRQSIHKYIDDWNDDGGISWVKSGGWNDTVEKARRQFAQLIGAKPENIAYSFGNSVAFSSIMSGFDFTAQDTILFNDLDFPSAPSNIMAQTNSGAKYHVIQSEDNKVSIDKYEHAIDNNTKLITACEVASNTGARIDVDQLVETAHNQDIPVFLDTYQSTGVIPIDVRELDIDFLASGCLKWLVGGFGISFLYIRDDWIDILNPSSIGWMGVDDPFQDLFDKLRTTLHRPSDATKFQYGTPYPFGAVTASAGMKLVSSIGIKTIYQHDMVITQLIIDEAINRGYKVQTPIEKEQRGSIVNVVIEFASKVVQKLQDEGFILDMRSGGIRLAPHFFSNSEDVMQLFDKIDEISKHTT